MQTTSAGGYVDFSRFGALRQEATSDERAALAKVADEFEALFVDLMLKAARDAEIKGGLFDSQAMSTYREMFDHQIAMTLAHNHDLGIGRAMARQFEGLLDDGDTPMPAALNSTDTLRRYTGATPAALPTPWREPDDRRQAFRERLTPYAEEAGRRLGLPANAILAQAALETGWGEHVIRRPDGSSSHNYFGIKAGSGWTGDVVQVPTTEYIDGRAVTVQAAFRAYETPLEGFRDYIDFLGENQRYRDVLASGSDAVRFARELERSGYATDPRYAEKIISILETGAVDMTPGEGGGAH